MKKTDRGFYAGSRAGRSTPSHKASSAQTIQIQRGCDYRVMPAQHEEKPDKRDHKAVTQGTLTQVTRVK